jgi:hypothetical protein
VFSKKFLPDNSAMHTLISYASPPGPHCQDALQRLTLPHLHELLQLLSPTASVRGKAEDFTPVSERVIAQAHGLDGPDGLIPWAADEAQRLGLTTLHGTGGWAWITPCHWTLQSNHATMDDPVQLSLTPRDCETFRAAMHPYFAEDGVTLFTHAPGQPHTRWLAHGDFFKQLPTASLDRVAGRTIDPWLPRQEQARELRRLQNEMQMLLYTHPLNDQRKREHLPTVNAFWVSGTGTPVPSKTPLPTAQNIALRDSLRNAALDDDAASWVMAWHALDASTMHHEVQRARKAEPVTLTLCSATQAQSFSNVPLSTWERLRRKLSPVSVRETLITLCN